MRRAALAGVDTIEHGIDGTEATFRLMAEKHIAYMPTLTATEAYAIYFHHYVPGTPPTEEMQDAAHAFALARKAGVTIGCGSDLRLDPATVPPNLSFRFVRQRPLRAIFSNTQQFLARA